MGNRREGKQIVYNTGFILNLFAFILQIIAFVSPYWFQSWPRIHSSFKKIGLWEACFAGLILERDPAQKAYHGCWWTLAPEFYAIRSWLMPWWFIITQVACTLMIILQAINVIVGLVLFCSGGGGNNSGMKTRPSMTMVQITTIFTILIAIAMSAILVLFGSAVYVDRSWMPRPDLNYLSWSYGLEVVGAFFMIFASIALVVYNRIVRQEYREPPSLTTPMMQVKDTMI